MHLKARRVTCGSRVARGLQILAVLLGLTAMHGIAAGHHVALDHSGTLPMIGHAGMAAASDLRELAHEANPAVLRPPVQKCVAPCPDGAGLGCIAILTAFFMLTLARGADREFWPAAGARRSRAPAHPRRSGHDGRGLLVEIGISRT